MEVQLYLNFADGQCLEAMEFYRDTLGGEFTGVFRNGDAPEDSRMPGVGDDHVMNMGMRLAGTLIMASDAPPEYYQPPAATSVVLAVDSAEEAERIYAALSKDAKTMMMPMEETFWAERYAMFTDRFGTPWMINFTGNKAME